MSSLELLRYFDLVAICLSVGFISAAALSHRAQMPPFMHGLGFSYVLFALGSAVEIELALHTNEPFSWRTVLVTVGALAGIVTAVWSWVDRDH